MSCYHPRTMIVDGYSSSGKLKYKFVPGQILSMSSQEKLELEKQGLKDKVISVPCKKCIGCRLDYSRRWADRLMLELDHSKTALFITLTYNDDNLTFGSPIPFYTIDESTGEAFEDFRCMPTLVKKDVQDFNKRLREYFEGKTIRFFLAGEYGSKNLRPHYHGIYFGLSLSDFDDKQFFKFNENHQPIFISPRLERLWKHGFVTLANVSWQSCAYVARYNLKKLGASKSELASERGVLDEFSLMSRNKGIGAYFLEDHPEILDSPGSPIYIKDPYGVKSVNKVNFPEYFMRKLELINKPLYDSIKEERKLYANDRFLIELSKQDLSEMDYLDLKESEHERSSKSLVRSI